MGPDPIRDADPILDNAFPNTGNSSWGMAPSPGMQLRDFFAAMAASGSAWHIEPMGWSADSVAREAYEIADAMLAQRDVL